MRDKRVFNKKNNKKPRLGPSLSPTKSRTREKRKRIHAQIKDTNFIKSAANQKIKKQTSPHFVRSAKSPHKKNNGKFSQHLPVKEQKFLLYEDFQIHPVKKAKQEQRLQHVINRFAGSNTVHISEAIPVSPKRKKIAFRSIFDILNKTFLVRTFDKIYNYQKQAICVQTPSVPKLHLKDLRKPKTESPRQPIEQLIQKIKKVKDPYFFKRIIEAIPVLVDEQYSMLRQSIQRHYMQTQKQVFENFQKKNNQISLQFQSKKDQTMKELNQTLLQFKLIALRTCDSKLIQQKRKKKKLVQLVQSRIQQQSLDSRELTNKVNTSQFAINSFIVKLYKFINKHYRTPFIELINSPCGLSISTRLAKLQNRVCNSLEDFEENIECVNEILGQSIFIQFQQSSKLIEQVKPQFSEFAHHHNRAIFDAFNSGLNYYRSYFGLNGEPYPWTVNEKGKNYYSISEENMQEVFEKTSEKVLQHCSVMAGMHIQASQEQIQIQNQFIIKVPQDKNYRSKHLASLSLVCSQHLRDELFWNDMEQDRTSLMIQLAQAIEHQLILQALRLK